MSLKDIKNSCRLLALLFLDLKSWSYSHRPYGSGLHIKHSIFHPGSFAMQTLQSSGGAKGNKQEIQKEQKLGLSGSYYPASWGTKRYFPEPRKGLQCRSVSLDKPLPSASQTPEPAEPKIMGREAKFFFFQNVSLFPWFLDLLTSSTKEVAQNIAFQFHALL